MELQTAFGAEQNFPEVGPEVVPEKQIEKDTQIPENTQNQQTPETVWSRVDPNHLQLPEPHRKPVADIARFVVTEQEPVRGSQPESVGDLLKTQTLPKLDIRPQHFYTEPEVRAPHQTEQDHDILPQVSTHTAPQNVETFEAPIQATPKTVEHRTELSQPQTEIHLGRHELLLLAGTITVGSENLLTIFSANRIDEDALRRIIDEFLSGKPIEELVKQEETRQQMKFELDPNLRHAPEATASLASRAADVTAKIRKPILASAPIIKQQTVGLGEQLSNGFSRLLEERDEPTSPVKMTAWAVGIVIYLIVFALAWTGKI